METNKYKDRSSLNLNLSISIDEHVRRLLSLVQPNHSKNAVEGANVIRVEDRGEGGVQNGEDDAVFRDVEVSGADNENVDGERRLRDVRRVRAEAGHLQSAAGSRPVRIRKVVLSDATENLGCVSADLNVTTTENFLIFAESTANLLVTRSDERRNGGDRGRFLIGQENVGIGSENGTGGVADVGRGDGNDVEDLVVRIVRGKIPSGVLKRARKILSDGREVVRVAEIVDRDEGAELALGRADEGEAGEDLIGGHGEEALELDELAGLVPGADGDDGLGRDGEALGGAAALVDDLSVGRDGELLKQSDGDDEKKCGKETHFFAPLIVFLKYPVFFFDKI